MEPRKPPKFVPTLTEIVPFDEEAEGLPPPGPPARQAPAGIAADAQQMPNAYTPEAIDLQAGLEADIARRVLQRVQATLQAQLAPAVEDLVRQHTQAMLAPLNEKIATVVREAVAQAVQQELDAGQ